MRLQVRMSKPDGAACCSLLAACAGLILSGCQVEKRNLGPGAPVTAPTGLGDPRGRYYETNRYQASEGGRLFRWQGCGDCHTDPAPGYLDLADAKWRAGGATAQIYQAIAAGRPGMPAFSARLTPEQIWQLAGHVHGLHELKPEQRRRSSNALAGEPSGASWRGALP